MGACSFVFAGVCRERSNDKGKQLSAFEPIYILTFGEVMRRLEYAGSRASEPLVSEPARWHGWLTFQTGISFPLDLFTKYVHASTYRDAMEAYGTVEDQDFARNAVQNYLTPLTAIVYSHVGLPKKVAA